MEAGWRICKVPFSSHPRDEIRLSGGREAGERQRIRENRITRLVKILFGRKFLVTRGAARLGVFFVYAK